MKYEEYESKMNSILANPDTALADMPSFMESLKTDLTALSEMAEKVDGLNARIKELQETNLKLYLSQGGQPNDEEVEEEKTGTDAIDAFWSKLEKEE